MNHDFHKKERPLLGLTGSGGGLGYLAGAIDPINLPFSASGGSKTGPVGGYYYHTFDASPSPQTFSIISGKHSVEVVTLGSGGAGGGGGPPGGDEAGAGGGGGGVGVFTIGQLVPGDYTVQVNFGGQGAPYPPSYNPGPGGGPSRFDGPPNYPGGVYAGGGPSNYWAYNSSGGAAGGGSWPSSPSFTTNNWFSGGPGQNGDNRPPHPSRQYGPINGGFGGNAGQYGSSGWWTPFIGPGKGGWNPSPWPTGKSGYSQGAPGYGGGGGGAGRGGTGGSGGHGRVIVRYPDSPGL